MADGDKPKSTDVLQKVTEEMRHARPPVRPYLLIIVFVFLLTVIMPSLPKTFTFQERIGVIFCAGITVVVILFLGLAYELAMMKFSFVQQRLEVLRYDQQAANYFPREVTGSPPTLEPPSDNRWR